MSQKKWVAYPERCPLCSSNLEVFTAGTKDADGEQMFIENDEVKCMTCEFTGTIATEYGDAWIRSDDEKEIYSDDN